MPPSVFATKVLFFCSASVVQQVGVIGVVFFVMVDVSLLAQQFVVFVLFMLTFTSLFEVATSIPVNIADNMAVIGR